MAADEQHEDAQRQTRDPDAGRVLAEADGYYDTEDDEPKDEIPIEVVERPGARTTAEGPTGRGLSGKADGAGDEGGEAGEAEDNGEDAEDVGSVEGGGVVEG